MRQSKKEQLGKSKNFSALRYAHGQNCAELLWWKGEEEITPTCSKHQEIHPTKRISPWKRTYSACIFVGKFSWYSVGMIKPLKKMYTQDSTHLCAIACRFVIGVNQQQQCTDLQEHKHHWCIIKMKDGWISNDSFNYSWLQYLKSPCNSSPENQFPVAWVPRPSPFERLQLITLVMLWCSHL